MSKPNVDAAEIEQFSKLANDWWDPKGPMEPLHQLNPLRMQYILKYSSLENKKILDVGCGGGLLSESLSQAGAKVTGIDLSEAALQVARDHDTTHQIDYQKISIEDFAEKNPGSFDVVTCMELLEHVPDPASVIKACAKLIKPDGLVFFSTLNRTLKAFAIAIVGAEYLFNKLPKGTHHYSKFIKPAELCNAARDATLHLENLQGVTYQPFRKNFCFSEDLSVNYLACFIARR